MKTMLFAFVTVAFVAIAADVTLNRSGLWSTQNQTAGPSVRLD